MRIRMLGPLEVSDGDRAVSLPRGHRRLLLAILLVRAGETVSSDRLIDALWGESPPPSAASSLHNLVSAMRQGLDAGRVVTDDGGYRLELHEHELDRDEFEQLAAEGAIALAAGRADDAVEVLEAGLRLWRGPPFGELGYHPALAGEAARLEEARMTALEDRIDADLARGRHAAVLPELDALVADHPLRERLRGQQMLALYRSGRQADALAVHRETRERLVAELGIEPGPGLRSLHQAILEHDPALGAPDALPAPVGSRRWFRRHAGALVAAAALLIAAGVVTLARPADEAQAPPVPGSPRDFVAVIDPVSNEITGRLPTGRTPVAVASGEGAVWTVDGDENRVSRIDLRTGEVRRIDTGTVPLAIAAGEGGAWVVGGNGAEGGFTPSAVLTRLDPISGSPVDQIPLPPRSGMMGLPAIQLVAAGAGAVWAIGREGHLVRVDPRTGGVKVVRGLRASRVVVAGDEVWVLAETSRGMALTRLDPVTGAARKRLPVEPEWESRIAIAAGSLWVTDATNGGVWRVDPAGGEPRMIPVDPGVDGVGGDDGILWLSNTMAGTVARVDPRRGAVVERLSLDGAARGVAVGPRAVWVATSGAARPAPAAAAGGRGLARLRAGARGPGRGSRRPHRLRGPVRGRLPAGGRGGARGDRLRPAGARLPRGAVPRGVAGLRRRPGADPVLRSGQVPGQRPRLRGDAGGHRRRGTVALGVHGGDAAGAQPRGPAPGRLALQRLDRTVRARSRRALRCAR